MKTPVLYISRFLQHPPSGGPQIRVDSSIKVLSQICELHIASLAAIDFVGGQNAIPYFRHITPHFTFTEAVAPGIKLKIKALLGKMFRFFKLPFAGRTNNLDWIIRYVDQNNIKIIWVNYSNYEIELIKQIKRRRPDLIIIGDTDSVWHRFLSRGVKYHHQDLTKEIKASKQNELEQAKYCDYLTAVSEVDARYYRSLKQTAKICLFPNLIDISNTAKIYKNNQIKSKYILLPGSFGPNSPMNDAASWLCKNVMPLVWQKHPELKVVLAGNNSEHACQEHADSRIIRTGRVPDMSSYLSNASVVVVPLRFESGTRYKILEAGKYKKPVVSTTLGAEGLEVKDNVHLLIADTSRQFANSIILFLGKLKLSRKMGSMLFQLVKAKYSLENGTLYGQLIIDDIITSAKLRKRNNIN